MSELVFGEKPKNFRYAVIVCPKCRQHAQIIETGKKTLKCQHCGAILQTRRLQDILLFRRTWPMQWLFGLACKPKFPEKEAKLFRWNLLQKSTNYQNPEMKM